MLINLFEINPSLSPNQKPITFNNTEIQIKQYLPIEDKLNIIESTVSISFTPKQDNENIKYYNTALRTIAFDYFLAKYYTDLDIPDIDEVDIYTVYDILSENNLITVIKCAIPKEELEFFNFHINKRIKEEFRCISEEKTFLNVISKFLSDINESIPGFVETMNNLDSSKFDTLREVLGMKNIIEGK